MPPQLTWLLRTGLVTGSIFSDLVGTTREVIASNAGISVSDESVQCLEAAGGKFGQLQHRSELGTAIVFTGFTTSDQAGEC